MMKKIYILMMALLTLSCAKQDKTEQAEQQADQEQIIITAQFETAATDSTQAKAAATRATETNFEIESIGAAQTASTQATRTQAVATRATATAFESGDELGMFVIRGGQDVQSAGNLINNAKLVVAADGAIKGTPDPIYYPGSASHQSSPSSSHQSSPSSHASSPSSKATASNVPSPKSLVTIYSYYPYQSGDATADALGVLVGIHSDQTDFSDQKRSDLCYGARADISPSNSTQSVTFTHKFAQVSINVTAFAEVRAVRLINVKDSAKLNVGTGAITLKPHTTEVIPFRNSTTNFTAIIPAQTLSGACVAIDLADDKTYIYNATTPINLKQSATNTLNLSVSKKGITTLDGEPSVTAWASNTSSGVVLGSINNQITLMWLAPHVQFAMADRVTLTVVDPLNVTREIDLVPTLDVKSSLQYAVYSLNLALTGTHYPLSISRIRIYAGATLLRDCISAAIIGSTLSKAGPHTLAIHLSLYITPIEDWLNVSGYGASRTITVTTSNNAQWVASTSGTGLSVSPTTGKNGETATLTWAANMADVAPLTRTGSVTFATAPAGVSTTVITSQNGAVNSIIVNGLRWAVGNLVANGPNSCVIGAPGDGGLYFQYGGLIGYKGGATGDGRGIIDAAKHPLGSWWNGATAYSSNEVAVTPAGYSKPTNIYPNFQNKSSGGYGYYYYNTFTTPYADFQSQPNGTNVSLGIGDPCAHYLGSPWRLPKYNELSAIIGNVDEGTPFVEWSKGLIPGKPTSSGPPANKTPGTWLGPNSRTGTPTLATDLFIPAPGHRDIGAGTFCWVGYTSYISGSSNAGSFGGFILRIDIGVGVYPKTQFSWNYALSVRCVKS